MYRFIGDYAELRNGADVKVLNSYGQKIDLTQQEYERHIVFDMIPLISDADFATLDISDVDLQKYPSAASQVTAPPHLQQKFAAGRQIFMRERQELAARAKPSDLANEQEEVDNG